MSIMDEIAEIGGSRRVTMKELVKKTGYTRQGIYNLIESGMPVYQEARGWIFDIEAVWKYLEETGRLE